jgi:hypothetical protein
MAEPDKPAAPPAVGNDTAPDPPPNGLIDSLKSIGEIAGVLTGIAFITGWLYWSTYYSSFGLNPLELGFSVAVVSVSPVQVILRDWTFAQIARNWNMMAVLAGYMTLNIALAVLFVRHRASRHPHGTARSRVPLVLLALAMFVGGYVFGRYDALQDSGCNSKLPNVAFLTSAEHPPTDADAAAPCLDNELSCKLVLHANSTYYYFQTPECEGSAAASVGAGLATAALPDSEVRMIRVQRTIGW